MTKQLVLASQSPRRRELLRNAGIPHVVRASEVDETRFEGEPAQSFVRRLAMSKAMTTSCSADEVVLAADTVVVLDGEVFGKPASAADAGRMLSALSGREHVVLTGICVRHKGGVSIDAEETRVRFVGLSKIDIEAYVDSGEPMDKAGAYAIQGLASKYIDRIDGCYFNVVGLPIALVWKYLARL